MALIYFVKILQMKQYHFTSLCLHILGSLFVPMEDHNLHFTVHNYMIFVTLSGRHP